MLALGLSLILFAFWTLVGQAVLAVLKLRLGLLRAWLLAPSVGLAVVILVLMVGNQAGWPIGKFAWPMTLVLAGAAAVVLVWRRPCLPWRALAPFAVVALFSLLWTGWPALQYGFNWLSYVNDDFTNYCLSAERFKDAGFWKLPTMTELAGTDQAQYYWFSHVSGLIRFGGEHVLAWVATLCGRATLNIFMPAILGLGLVQLSAAAGLVLYLGRWRRRALLAMALLAVSPLFILGTLYQLLAQVGGMGLLLAAVAIATARLPGTRIRRLLPHIAALALLSAALCVYYPEVTPFAALAVGLFTAVEWARTRALPVARLRLALYAFLGTVVLLNYNLVSYIFTFLAQLSTGLRQVDLSISLFPYFMIPTGLANLFGLLPLAHNWPEPLTSLAILGGGAALLAVVAVGLRASLRPTPAGCLLLGMMAFALKLFFGGNDFGLFKIAMFLQPLLAAMLAETLLHLPRPRRAAPIAVLVVGLLCAPTAFYYSNASRGLIAGNITEIKFASRLGVTRPAVPPDTRLLSDISNLVVAKLAALRVRGTDLRYLARDYYQIGAPIVFPQISGALHALLRLHPHYDDLIRTEPLIEERDSTLWRAREVFLTAFRTPALTFEPQANPDAYLSVNPLLGPFNKFRYPPHAQPDDFFAVLPRTAVENMVVFVHSSRGNHYYLGNRRLIGLYQQEKDPFSADQDMTGLGRFLLLRIERPSQPLYLRIAASKSLMGSGRTAWSRRGKILAQQEIPLAFAGDGAVNRIIGPIQPVWLDGSAYIALDFGETAGYFPFHRTGLQALYHADVPLDSRLLVAFSRDISALSPADVAALPRPKRIARFPDDLVNARGLEFSGIYEDGWISPEAEFTFGEAQPGDVVRIKGYIPQIPGQTADTSATWSVSVNGGAPIILGARTGSFDWLFPVAQPAKTTRVSLRFTSRSTLPGGDDRPVGAKLELLEVMAPPSSHYEFGTVGATRLAAQGIDQDGWCTKTASFVLPAQPHAGTLAMRFEYPGWGGNGQPLRVRVDGKLVHTQNLTPGITEVSLTLAASSAPQTVELLSKEEFPLPSPDGRRRSEQLLTVELQPARSSPEAAVKPATTGIDADGWIEPQATVVLPAQAKPAELLLRVEFPGWSGEPQAAVRVGLTGLGATAQTLKPGENQIRLRLPDATVDQIVRIDADNSFLLPAPDGRRRIGRLLGIELRSIEPPDFTGGLAAQGIDTDGWVATKASVVVPAHPAPAELEFRFEYPGWSGRAQGAVSINIADGPSTRQTLDPGATTVRIALAPAVAAQSVVIEGDEFVLPAPDGRRRVCRLLATALRPLPIP